MRRFYTGLFAIIIFALLGTGAYFAVPAIFGSVVAPLPEEYQGMILTSAREFSVDSCFIAAVIRGESNWNPGARSGAGATGMMQLIGSTADSMARRLGISVSRSQLKDPAINIRLGTSLLKYNKDNYGGNLRNIVVAYNAGGGRVSTPDKFLPRETQGYIVKISNYYKLYTSIYPDFCTGPPISGGPPVQTVVPAEDFPDFVSPSSDTNNLNINSFWKNWLTQ